MKESVVDGWLLAEIVSGTPAELSDPLREAATARIAGQRARFAAKVAQRLRPQTLRAGPPRAQTLLGETGPAPRRRYRPPAGLAVALRRILAQAEPIGEDAARGAGRVALARLGSDLEGIDPEEAAAILALRAHVDVVDAEERASLERCLAALRTLAPADLVVALGRSIKGEGDDLFGRGGRELRELEASMKEA
ncbi:MAG: hypothetical protein AAGE52_11180 [Myxococcota bacterium]